MVGDVSQRHSIRNCQWNTAGRHANASKRATVQSVRGGEEIDVTGFLDFDEQLDLAILNLDQTNEAIKELEGVRLGRGVRRGRGLRTMGAGQFIDSRVTLNLGLCHQSYSQKQPVSVSRLARKGYRGSAGRGIGRLLSHTRADSKACG